MKKVIPVLLALMLLLTIPASAASGKLTADSPKGAVGEQVKITLHLDNPGIIATLIRISYDTQVLRLDGAENGDVFASSAATFGQNTSVNPYIVLWLDALAKTNNTKSGTLCTVKFTVLKGTESGKTTVRFAVDKGNTFDADTNEVTVESTACNVQVPVDTAAATGSAAESTTKAVSAGTTKAGETTTKASDATTKAGEITSKAGVTTTKPIVSAATTKAPVTTTKAVADTSESAGTTAAAASTSAASSGETTAATTARTGESTVADADIPTVPESALPDDTQSDVTAAAEGESAVPETAQAEEAVELLRVPEDGAHKSGKLWLLLILPVAAVVVVVIVVKKNKS